MPPAVITASREQSDMHKGAASQFRDQWRNPKDSIALLLIIGPEIIQAALAQQVGYLITPTVFSFGWVAYAFNALLSVFGDHRLMPPPDFPARLISAQFCHVRDNKSWVIGRLLRDSELKLDYEPFSIKRLFKEFSEKLSKKRLKSFFPTKQKARQGNQKPPFRVQVFSFDQNAIQGEIKQDTAWSSGFFVMLIQVAISIVPVITKRNWAPVTITTGGTLLALLQGAIPQWKEEKWDWSDAYGNRVAENGRTVSITQGNGSRYVMVILGKDYYQSRKDSGTYEASDDSVAYEVPENSGSCNHYKAPDLETMAAGSQGPNVSRFSSMASVALAVLWTILLISVTGLDEDTWYLMAVGLLGMIHSICIAGMRRESSALGIHLIENKELSFETPGIPEGLQLLEERCPRVGSSLVSTFFPGGMTVNPDKEEFWNQAAEQRGHQGCEKLGIRIDRSKARPPLDH